MKMPVIMIATTMETSADAARDATEIMKAITASESVSIASMRWAGLRGLLNGLEPTMLRVTQQ